MNDDILNHISPNEALEIVKQLARTDKGLKKQIIELAKNHIKTVDVEDICESVFDALDWIDVHELWDRAGPNRDGYISPEEMSCEMFEEAIAPHVQEMERLLKLKMHHEAKLYCMGILKGIYQYEQDSGSEFKDWATDIPGEIFGSILKSWAKNSKNKDKKEMMNFIHEECFDWSGWAINQI